MSEEGHDHKDGSHQHLSTWLISIVIGGGAFGGTTLFNTSAAEQALTNSTSALTKVAEVENNVTKVEGAVNSLNFKLDGNIKLQDERYVEQKDRDNRQYERIQDILNILRERG